MRFAALPLIFGSLILGMLAGLWRAGFVAINLDRIAMVHGSLMTGSFLGSLISLERAIVVKKWYAYLVPILSAASMPMFFIQPEIGFLLLCVGSLGLMAIMSYLYLKYTEWYQLIFIVGAACWLIGNILILSGDYYFFAAPWWMLFFLLTITAERMELARFVLLKTSRVVVIVIFLALAFISLLLPFHSFGKELLGASFALVALALMRYDMARKSAKSNGIHRYSGVALLIGYAWLFLAGIGMIFLPFEGLAYDALLHMFFVGFVISMILAHGPIILPAVLQKGSYVFHSVLWVWVVALNASLLLRIGSDMLANPHGRLYGSWGNAVTILGFLITVVILVFKKKQIESPIKTASN